jgi:hypothetical protein
MTNTNTKRLPTNITELWKDLNNGGYDDDPELYLLHYAILKARKDDAKFRDERKHYGSASPIIKPQRGPFIESIAAVFRQKLASLAGNTRLIQGANRDFAKLLAIFTNAFTVPPQPNEIDQPELGIYLLANIVGTALLDNLTVQGRPSIELLSLASKLVLPIEVEYWSRCNMRDNSDIVAATLKHYGTKQHSTLEQRITNITLVFNKRGIPKPNLKNLLPGCVAIIEMFLDPSMWQDGKTMLIRVNDSSVVFNDQVKQQLLSEDNISWANSTMLPITNVPKPWRATDQPDCFNTTGGFHNPELRRVTPLGHGRHRHYRTTSSQAAVQAVNCIQSTQYVIDERVANFVLQLIEYNQENRDHTFKNLPAMPRFTRKEIEDGTADLEEVKKRKEGAELIPDKEARNEDAGLQRIKTELGFDWKENNKKLAEHYATAMEQEDRYRRTCLIQSRIKELLKDYFKDGFYFSSGIDHRGRIYAKADIFGPQGSKPERACLNFKNGEELTEATLREVHIAIGGAAAGTKISYDEREQVGKSLHTHLIDIGADLMAHRTEIFSADAPWTYAQLASGMYRYYKLGEPWNVPLASDATNSGIQWWASITNDEKVMGLANLTKATFGSKPSDAYAVVGEAVASVIPDFKFTYKDKVGRKHTCTKEEREVVIKLATTRACLKNSIMTKLYGSHVLTRGDDITSMAHEHLTEDELKIFHDKLGVLTASLIEKAMKDTFANQDRAMNIIKDAARLSVRIKVAGYRRVKSMARSVFRFNMLQSTNGVLIDAVLRWLALNPFLLAELQPDELKERQEKYKELEYKLEEYKEKPTDELSDDIQEIKDWLHKQETDNTHYPKKVLKVVRESATTDPFTRRVVEFYDRIRLEEDRKFAVDAAKADCKLQWLTSDGTRVVVREPFSEGDVIKVGVLPQMRVRISNDHTIDQTRLAKAAAPSFIHSFDSCLMRRIVTALNTDALCVHDSIALLPSRLPQLRKLVGEQMAKMIGTDGRNLLRHYINNQFNERPYGVLAKTWKDAIEMLMNSIDSLPEPIDYNAAVVDSIYAWN